MIVQPSTLKSFFSFFICLISLAALAIDTPVKEIKKSFNVNKDVRLNLNADFATVRIETWNELRMEVHLVISAEAKSEDRAKAVLDKITTLVEEGTSQAKVEVTAGNTSCRNNEHFEIDITIKMPIGGSIDGDCDFGDVTIGDFNGTCKMNVEYGVFSSGSLRSSNNDIRVGFGDSNVREFGGGSFNAEYGVVTIEKVSGNADINSDFGDLSIRLIDGKCKQLNLNVDYGTVDLNLSNGASLKFDIKASYGEISFPPSVKRTKKEEGMSQSVTGQIGDGSAGQLNVKASFGDVTVK